MEKKMEPLAVKTVNGVIWIDQDVSGRNGQAIGLSIDQVPILIAWLQEAAKELQSEAAWAANP
jgi:hypothetical protein